MKDPNVRNADGLDLPQGMNCTHFIPSNTFPRLSVAVFTVLPRLLVNIGLVLAFVYGSVKLFDYIFYVILSLPFLLPSDASVMQKFTLLLLNAAIIFTFIYGANKVYYAYDPQGEYAWLVTVVTVLLRKQILRVGGKLFGMSAE